MGIGKVVRELLARKRCVVGRLEPEVPPTLHAYFASLQPSLSGHLVYCLDHEVRLQTSLLELFPRDRVIFFNPTLTNVSAPTQPFVAILDALLCPVDETLNRFPWLANARVLVVRVRLAAALTGDIDVTTTAATVENRGFQGVDFVDWAQVNPLRPHTIPAAFIFTKPGFGPTPGKAQRYRRNEALACLARPIARRSGARILVGRGSFGYAAGLWNPGAVETADGTLLLARPEPNPWAERRRSSEAFFDGTPPVAITITPDGQIADSQALATSGFPDPRTNRAEDFRLFRFRGETFSNHTLMSAPGEAHGAVDTSRMQIRPGVSRWDVPRHQFQWLGFAEIDRPLGAIEKNWVMFASDQRLLMVYSFSPFILMEATAWPKLSFRTIVDARITTPLDGDGLSVRNSINPIDYDDAHWLHVVHKVYPTKHYVFWGVLIDKRSLRPIKMTARPLLNGASMPAGIIYACAAVCAGGNVTFYAGLDDCALGAVTVTRSEIDREWKTLA